MVKLLKMSVAAVLLAGFAYVIYLALTATAPQRQAGKRGGGMERDLPVPVLAAKVKLADVPVHLEGMGTARARNTVTVRPQVDGKIVSIAFREGQDVKRGDVLARIEAATYQAQLDQALAKKALAEVQLENARRDLERYAKLTSNVIAAKTIDTQKALVAQYQAQIRQEEAAINNARTILGYTTITAPIDGRTGMRLVDEGNIVKGSDAGIVVITEVKPITVLFTLPQQQLPQVNTAAARGAVQVEALAPDNRTVLDRGTLQVVDNQIDQATGTVKIKAEFPNADLQLWPGQFANVRLLVDTLNQVTVVPTPAVQRGPSGTFAFVVQGEGVIAQRPITVAQQGESESVVSAGLTADEVVVTTGFARLRDGAKVSATVQDGPVPVSRPPAADVRKAPAGAAEAAPGERRRRGEGKGDWQKRKSEGGTGGGGPGAGAPATTGSTTTGSATTTGESAGQGKRGEARRARRPEEGATQ